MGGIALPEGGTKARGTQRLHSPALLDLWVQPQLLLTQMCRLRELQEPVQLGLVSVTGDANVSVTGVAGTGAVGSTTVTADSNLSVTGVAGHIGFRKFLYHQYDGNDDSFDQQCNCNG